MAWMLLLGGRSGLINVMLRDIGLGDLQLSIYSWWGIVWVHLVTGMLPVKVFLLVPAFRNLDASLEEASRTSGARSEEHTSELQSLMRISYAVFCLYKINNKY